MSRNESSDDSTELALLDVVRQFEDEPVFAIPRILSMVCRGVGAKAGRILLLSAETGQLEPVAWFPEPAEGQADTTSAWPTLDLADYPTTPTWDDALYRSPAVRSETVVGAVELDGAEGTPRDRLLIEAVTGILPMARANRSLHTGLIHVPPIPDVDGDEGAFRSEVHAYLDAHTRTALTCVFAVDQNADVAPLFGPPDPVMAQALENPDLGIRVLDAALAAPSVAYLGQPGLPGVVDATLIGHRPTTPLDDTPGNRATGHQPAEETRYVLLAGFGFRYRPSPAEITVLRYSLGLAAHLHGIYEHIHDVAGRLGQVAEIGSAITGLEISQKARHHAFTQIDLAQHLLADLSAPSSQALVDDISLALGHIHTDLVEIKNATRAPGRERIATFLKPLWLSACAQVRHRLGSRIRVHYDGPDVEVIAAPDWFRQVFLNLLLNSADAFGNGGRQGRIVLQIDRPSIGSGMVRMTYSDTARGIMPQHFLDCEVGDGVDLRHRIFLPGVTSKDGGSGWGLHVCRSILRAHHGSIELEDGRRGASFRISLPVAGGSS